MDPKTPILPSALGVMSPISCGSPSDLSDSPEIATTEKPQQEEVDAERNEKTDALEKQEVPNERTTIIELGKGSNGNVCPRPVLSKKTQAGLSFKDFAKEQAMSTASTRGTKKPKRSVVYGEKLIRREIAAQIHMERVHDCELHYRLSGSTILFKTDSIVRLLDNAVPTRAGIANFRAGVKVVNAKRSSLNPVKDGEVRREFVSWNAIRLLINEGLFDQALRDMLNTYEPLKGDDCDMSDTSRRKASIEKDHITVSGVDIPFLVSKGRVFFDILGSFSILGELKLAMRNRWEKVDTILQANGLSQREAFRRCPKSTVGRTTKAFSSHRSHISLRALLVLVANGLVNDEERKIALEKLFVHIAKEVDSIGEKKQRLYDELQLVVERAVGQAKGELC